ncbi:hypothetical protein [Streptomyces sp. NPDC051657]|uniref:hypothetical protein n=1 Tax=unclassified Streptomyces TaxID=2593676 RepID=UPI00341411D8
MRRTWNEASRGVRVFLAVVLVSAFSFAVAIAVQGSLGDGDSSAYGKGYVSLYLRENPGIPPVLPMRLPEDVRFLGYDTTRMERGKAVMRSAQFAGNPYSAHPVQTVCIEWSQQESECASLVGRGEAVTRKLASIRLTVISHASPEKSAEVMGFWRDVRLTSDLNDAAWLQP